MVEMLQIQNVSATYGELLVLKGVDLEVHPSEIVSIIGPNGAGKSTVLKTIFSIAKVTKGKILLDDEEITGCKSHSLLSKGISYVPQGQSNFRTLSVRENLLFGVNFAEVKEEKAALESVFNVFPALRNLISRQAYGLSGGEQQMLALGRALIHHPRYLLLDEPSLGLSPKLQNELFEMLNTLRKEGIGILLVEQNVVKAVEIADRTYLLEAGKVVMKGGRDILNHPKIRSVYLGE